MKRNTTEQQQHDGGDQEEEFEEEQDGSVEAQGGAKRVNMPKKSKHRTRAHVNPMGDLNIPTYKV
jgi:hypothetical protein